MRRIAVLSLVMFGILVCTATALVWAECADLETDPDAETVIVQARDGVLTLTESDGAVHTFTASSDVLIEFCFDWPQSFSDAYPTLENLYYDALSKKANWTLKGNGVDSSGHPRPCITGRGCVRF